MTLGMAGGTGRSAESRGARSHVRSREPKLIGADGAPFDVDFRINWKQLAEVDTQKLTADVKVGVLMHWTDRRLVNWPSDRLLPPLL